jgi:hypothetical protein
MWCRWPRRARSPLGRRLLRGGRCDHHDQFNRSRVVRDRHRAGFGTCGASDSPRLAIVAGGARADQHRWRSPRTPGAPRNRVRPLPLVAQTDRRPQAPPPSSAAFVGPGQGKIGQDRPDPGSEPVVTDVGAILTLAPVCAAATLAPEVGGLATGLTARFTHHVQVEASSQA